MKHSLWRLISSFYILLISGLMVIISAYAWMVISKAPGVNGSSANVNIPKVFYDTITVSKETLDTFPIAAVDSTVFEEDKTIEFKIDSAEDFYVVMRAIAHGDIPQGVENVKLRLCAQISLEDTSVWKASDWKGVQTNALNVTIYADTNTLKSSNAYIYRLSDTLFQSVDTGSVAFYDITILEAEIKGDGNTGAFVSYAGAQASVSLKNCHVLESTIEGNVAGGLIGYANDANVLIKDCTVKESSVGVMLGTISGGETVIANAELADSGLFANLRSSVNAPYGSYDGLGILNLVDTELATVEVYGGFIQAAADCFTNDAFRQTWSVHGALKMTNEIRFRGNHVDIVGKENAVIELSENAGFNFGEFGENSVTEKFQANSSVKFADITFKNTKETNENTNDVAYYMYANARNAVYSDCRFDRGILVVGSAYISNCEIADDSRYCVKLIGDLPNLLCSITDSKLTAGKNAEGCVLSDGEKQIFAVYGSEFDNETGLPAVYLTGSMPVLTDGKNYFDSPCGGILAKEEGTCSFNDKEIPCPTFAQYQNADILDKAHWDRTEHGDNAAVRYPDADIADRYDSVKAEEIPSEMNPDAIEEDTDIYYIDSAEEFIAVMNMLNQKENGVSTLSGNYRIVLKTHIDLSGYDWESVSITDTNKTLKTVTIEADTATLGASVAFIKSLNAPLFNTLQSASANVVIKNITVVHSEMNLNTDDYSNSGAFVSTAKMSVTLDNCHLMNSTVISAPNAEGEYSRLGGIIGYTNAAEVVIQNCSVRGCVLKGASTGGIVGHASASKKNETYIVDCFVENTEMTCLEAEASWRVGEIVGTANQGGVTIVNPLVLENTLIQMDASDKQKNEQTQGNDPNYFLYGRFVPAGVGRMLFVDNGSEVHTALVYGGLNSKSARYLTSEKQLWLIYSATATLNEEIRFAGSDITLKAFEESATLILNSNSTSVFWKGGTASPSGFNFGESGEYQTSFKQNSMITFENLTFKNQKTYYSTKIPRYDERTYTYALAETVCYKNCVLEGGVAVYTNATFENCEFIANADSGFALVLSEERITAGDYTCVLTDCGITAETIKTVGRDYEIIQTKTE